MDREEGQHLLGSGVVLWHFMGAAATLTQSRTMLNPVHDDIGRGVRAEELFVEDKGIFVQKGGLVQVEVFAACEPRGSGGLYTLHDVWEIPPANNLPQTPHSAGAYGTGYVLKGISVQTKILLYMWIQEHQRHKMAHLKQTPNCYDCYGILSE
jgi:hypothetical protein